MTWLWRSRRPCWWYWRETCRMMTLKTSCMRYDVLSRCVPQGLSNLEMIVFSLGAFLVDWEHPCPGLQWSPCREL